MDENPAVRLFVELAVGSDVVRVMGAADGYAALASLDTTPPDLVLAAAGMTGLAGHDLGATLSSRKVPMVVMVGRLAQSSVSAPAAAVITKPLQLDELRDVVSRVVLGLPMPAQVTEVTAMTVTPSVPMTPGPDTLSEPVRPALPEIDVIDAWMSGADSALGVVPNRWRRLAAEGDVLHSFAHDLAAFRAGGATGYLKISSKMSITTPRRVATTRSPTM